MFQALIIGCGNIGALHDLETDSVATYAKAFYLDEEIAFNVYDVDLNHSRRVADRYGAQQIADIDQTDLAGYDIVVIASPTATHHAYLARLLKRQPRLVICEKPVDVDVLRLDQLAKLYRQSHARVMVNYFRRFQPEIIRLRRKIQMILSTQRCTNIVVTYQRGFHNNASHAIDLLDFLFSTEIEFDGAQITNRVFDEFETDPTLCVSGVWNGTNLQIIGLAEVQFSNFEVALFFRRKAVLLKDGANTIEEYSAPLRKTGLYRKLDLKARRDGVTDNYMVNVVAHAKRLLREKALRDNFLESVSISRRIQKLLNR